MPVSPTPKQADQLTCPKCGQANPAWYAACQKCGTGLSLSSANIAILDKPIRSKSGDPHRVNLSLWSHIQCGWPLILVLIGGAIGGLVGGLAYGLNITIFTSRIPGVVKSFLALVVGIIAIVAWYTIVRAILH